MERMANVGVPGMVGRFRPDQINHMSSWATIPDGDTTWASMHIIHTVPSNGSTETRVNPIDPGDGYYLEVPYSVGRVIPAGRIRG